MLANEGSDSAMSPLKVVLIVLGVMAALGLGTCVVCVAIVGKAAHDQSAGGPSVAPDAPAIPLTAQKLHDAYHANEVAADEAYKGRALRVTGGLVAISKDAFDHIVVELDTGNPFESVRATLDASEKAKAMSLSKGTAVAVLCQGGGMIIGSPILSGCHLQ
jgi:tRNA_anti-like